MSNINKWLKCFHGNGQKFFIKNTNEKKNFANAKPKIEKFSRKWSKFFAIKTLFAKCF